MRESYWMRLPSYILLWYEPLCTLLELELVSWHFYVRSGEPGHVGEVSFLLFLLRGPCTWEPGRGVPGYRGGPCPVFVVVLDVRDLLRWSYLFFFPKLPCGPCDLVSHSEWERQKLTIFINLGDARFAGETVRRKSRLRSWTKKQQETKETRARPATEPRLPPAIFFFVASAFRPVWPGRCIWALSVYRSRLAPWIRGESNHGKLSALRPLGHGRYRFATASAPTLPPARSPETRARKTQHQHKVIPDRMGKP